MTACNRIAEVLINIQTRQLPVMSLLNSPPKTHKLTPNQTILPHTSAATVLGLCQFKLLP